MADYEYKVIPAPKRGVKARGMKTTEAQFANALSIVMNEAAADGWEYQRTDTLPCDERSGLRGSTTSFQNMLVFRRMTAEAAAAKLRAATAEADAQRATLAALVAQAQAETPKVDAETAPLAIEGPKVEEAAQEANAAASPETEPEDAPDMAAAPAKEAQPAEARVQETLAAGPAAAGLSGTPKVPTPELRATTDARVAAE